MPLETFKKSPAAVCTLLAMLALLCALFALALGSLHIPLTHVLGALGLPLPLNEPVEDFERAALLQIRLPRVVLALLIGAALAQAGAAMQGLFRNPLAEPGLIGVSSGAALAAVSIIVLWQAPSWLLPLATFVGGMTAAWFVARIASDAGYTRVITMLLAGLAIGTVVVEAALRSGSLVTARLAAEQGREVYAVPGSIRNPAAQGCNALLKDGARLADTAPDLLNELAFSPLFDADLAARPVPPPITEATAAVCREATPRLDRDDEILLDALGFEPQDFDTLVARTGFRPAALAGHLLQLELAGLLELRAGGQYARLGTPGRAVPPAPSSRPTNPPH